MNRSLLVSLASVTLALFVGGCAADFDGQETGNEESNSSLEGQPGARFYGEKPTTNVEGTANIQDPRTAVAKGIDQRAAGHEALLVKMNQGGIDPQTHVDGH
jgi:hypothetical protein